MFKYRTNVQPQLANTRLWPFATGELDKFSIATHDVLDNAEDLQEFESTAGLICIKCADALKHTTEVLNLRLKFWIIFFLCTSLSSMSTWTTNPADFSFFNTSYSPPWFGVSAATAECENCDDVFAV